MVSKSTTWQMVYLILSWNPILYSVSYQSFSCLRDFATIHSMSYSRASNPNQFTFTASQWAPAHEVGSHTSCTPVLAPLSTPFKQDWNIIGSWIHKHKHFKETTAKSSPSYFLVECQSYSIVTSIPQLNHKDLPTESNDSLCFTACSL